MNTKDRATIATEAAVALENFAERAQDTSAVVGFDGFVDSIINVVDKRFDRERYDAVKTIDLFGQRVIDASGESTNFELVVERRKLGGNGPIMANAFASVGLMTTYIGALGRPQVDEVFKEFSHKAECISLAAPATTDALEFEDGKLMLGKLQSMEEVNWERIDEVLGNDTFLQMVTNAAIVAMVNWTMLPAMNEIWRAMLARLTPDPMPRPRYFFDLADPSKRTMEDLGEALGLIEQFQNFGDVIIGLNQSEAEQVALALALEVDTQPESMAAAIREKMNVAIVVVHPRTGAAAADANGTAIFKGPFVKEPKISTGAGDHFNAGFCLGQIAELDLAGSLCVGTATSGYYVRNAATPDLSELAEFCRKLPPPE